MILSNYLVGQDVLIIHKKAGGRDILLKQGKRMKIVTFDKHKFKGRYILLKDSSILLRRNGMTVSIPIKQMHYVYCIKGLGSSFADGVVVIVSAAFASLFINVLSIPVAVYEYSLLHRKKYDSYSYELVVFN